MCCTHHHYHRVHRAAARESWCEYIASLGRAYWRRRSLYSGPELEPAAVEKKTGVGIAIGVEGMEFVGYIAAFGVGIGRAIGGRIGRGFVALLSKNRFFDLGCGRAVGVVDAGIVGGEANVPAPRRTRFSRHCSSPNSVWKRGQGVVFH